MTEPSGTNPGVVTATHTYSAIAPRDIHVVVTNRFGATATRSISINRTTAITATPIALKLTLFGGIQIKTGSISATLVDGDGQPLSGRSIKFTALNGYVICTATTNAAGKASCPNPVFTLAAILSLHYRAAFAGGGGYQPISTTAPLIQLG
jgi:hypothetical protein